MYKPGVFLFLHTVVVFPPLLSVLQKKSYSFSAGLDLCVTEEQRFPYCFCFDVAKSASVSDFLLKSVYVKLIPVSAALFIYQVDATGVEIFQAPVSYPNAVFHFDFNQVNATKM